MKINWNNVPQNTFVPIGSKRFVYKHLYQPLTMTYKCVFKDAKVQLHVGKIPSGVIFSYVLDYVKKPTYNLGINILTLHYMDDDATSDINLVYADNDTKFYKQGKRKSDYLLVIE